MRDERGRSATASNGKKKNKSHAGLEFVRGNVIIEVQPAADQNIVSLLTMIRNIFARKFAVNKILPVIYFANLEESSLTNSF